jgi:hypothetical protein
VLLNEILTMFLLKCRVGQRGVTAVGSDPALIADRLLAAEFFFRSGVREV